VKKISDLQTRSRATNAVLSLQYRLSNREATCVKFSVYNKIGQIGESTIKIHKADFNIAWGSMF